MRLSKRVADLESRGFPFTGSHWIDCDNGETKDQAVARYEAEHGPILATDIAIIWVPASPLAPPCP